MSAVTSYLSSSDRSNSLLLSQQQHQHNSLKSKSFYIENLSNAKNSNHTMKTDNYMCNQPHVQQNESQLYFNWASNINFSNPHAEQNVNSGIQMELEDNDLWTRFANLTNEMILTKAGRRTFPLIKLRVSGLDESCLYTIQIEFKVSDLYKYRFVNGDWRTTPRNDGKLNQPQSILYEHSDSPNFGHHWVKESVAFGKLKLTNNEHTKCRDAVFLRSLNKYDPILHVYKHDKKNVDDKMLVFSKFFKQTQFIAVTAYQNEQITTLKIKHNPFAKAFLNNKPTITIDESGNAIMIPQIKEEATQKSKEDVNRVATKQVTTKQHTTNSIHDTISTNQDLIQNWYANYYNNSNQYQQFNNYIDPVNYSNNYGMHIHPYQVARTANEYFSYSHGQYTNPPYYQYHNHHQTQVPNQITGQLDYMSQTCISHQDQPKQSSPIYDPMYNNKSIPMTAIRTSHGHSNRVAPYSTTRPSKRNIALISSSSNANLVDKSEIPLSVSPVYNLTKLDFEQTDDSLNMTENFMSQMHNQTIQSSNSSASTSSYTLSSTTTSV